MVGPPADGTVHSGRLPSPVAHQARERSLGRASVVTPFTQ